MTYTVADIPPIGSGEYEEVELHRQTPILSHHRVREAITANILVFLWCDSSQNKSDILSKHWEFSKVFHTIRDLFDFQGKISFIQ